MKDYVVLDLENPNVRGNSICAIGVIVVKNSRIIDRKYTLINPEDRFDRNNVAITGIDAGMVLDSPTLPLYWTEIRDLLTENIIVGHNIRYDLSVLSKSLNRYDIEVPDFWYIDTLQLSRQLIHAPSYRLGALTEELGFSYQEHHALEDAAAAQFLFEHLKKLYPVNTGDSRLYKYERRLKKTIDEKLVSNINDLHGIIVGITADGRVNEEEICYLQKWIDDNSKYRNYAVFDRIITKLNLILEDGVVTDYEQRELLTIADSVNHSRIYTDATLAIQILDGILKGIACDKAIEDAEVESFKMWLADNDYLAGVYPYDKILNVVTKTLEDGVITENEKKELLAEFNEVLNPVSKCCGRTFWKKFLPDGRFRTRKPFRDGKTSCGKRCSEKVGCFFKT